MNNMNTIDNKIIYGAEPSSNIGYDMTWLKQNGLDIYDWELVCFNGFLENLTDDDFVAGTSSKARYTSERLTNDSIDSSYNLYITQDHGSYCMIKKEMTTGKYIRSGEFYDNEKYNNHGVLRNDLLYCDISIDTEENCDAYFNQYYYSSNNSEEHNNFIKNWIRNNKAKRHTYIYRNNELINIDTLFTDCTECIRETLRTNNGNMKLKENRMYYCKNFDFDGLFDISSYSNFVIDGKNSMLFCHAANISGMPCHLDKYKSVYPDSYKEIPIFKTTNKVTNKASNNFIIRNLKITSLHDKDNGCKSSSNDKRMSTSSSLLTAFLIDGKNIDIYNITIKNLKSAFNILGQNTNENNIRISDITAYSVEDNFINGIYIYLNKCVFSQKIYIGGNNIHLINHSNDSDRIFITNSVFMCFDNYTPAMININDSSFLMQEYNTHIYYNDCTLNGGVLFNGNYNVAGKQFIHFIDSYLIQLNNLYYSNNSNQYIPYILNLKMNSLELSKCYIESNSKLTEYMISTSGSISQIYIITNNTINTNTYTTNKILNTSLNGSQIISYGNNTSPINWNKVSCPDLFHSVWNEYTNQGADREQSIYINKNDADIYINMSTDSINSTCNGGTFYKDITSNDDWKIEYVKPTWLTVTKETNRVKIVVSQNNIVSQYNCQVTIRSINKNTIFKTFTVNLAASNAEPYINLTEDPQIFAYDGGDKYIDIESNIEWNIGTISEEWVTAIKENNQVKIIVGGNTENVEKHATVEIVSDTFIQNETDTTITKIINLILQANTDGDEIYIGSSNNISFGVPVKQIGNIDLTKPDNTSNNINLNIIVPKGQGSNNQMYDGDMNNIGVIGYNEISGLNSTYPINAPSYWIYNFPHYWEYNIGCFNGFLDYTQYDFTEYSLDSISEIYKYYNDIDENQQLTSIDEIVLKIFNDRNGNGELTNEFQEGVFEPSENILFENYKGINAYPYTSKDIYFDTLHSRFTIKDKNSDKYYFSWKRNNYYYNNDSDFINNSCIKSSNYYHDDSRYARKTIVDTQNIQPHQYNILYSDISLNGDNIPKRNTYVLTRGDDGKIAKFTNIWDLYEDATEYIYDTLRNYGGLTLESNKVYVMSPKSYNIKSNENPLYNKNGVLINGNGATLFVMMPKETNNNLNNESTFYNDIHYLFHAYNTKNLVIKNLKICCIADKDIHPIKNCKMLSSSNSGIGLLYVDGNSSSITIQNVDTYNCNTFHFNSGENISIDNWNAYNETQFYVNGTDVYVKNSNLSQKKIIGGMNLIYGSPYLLHFENCKFQVNSPFSSTMLNMSLSSSSRCIRFINCDFGGYQILENGYRNMVTDNGMQWMTFNNCRFYQLFHSYLYSKNGVSYLGISENPFMFQAWNTSQLLNNCKFWLDTLSLYIFNSTFDKECYCIIYDGNINFGNITYDPLQEDINDIFYSFTKLDTNDSCGKFIFTCRKDSYNPETNPNIGQPKYKLNEKVYVPIITGNPVHSSGNPTNKQYGNYMNFYGSDSYINSTYNLNIDLKDFANVTIIEGGDFDNAEIELGDQSPCPFMFVKELLGNNSNYTSDLISLIIYNKVNETEYGQYYYSRQKNNNTNIIEYKYNYLTNKIDLNTKRIYAEVNKMKTKIYQIPMQSNLFFTYLYCDIDNTSNTFMPNININPRYEINTQITPIMVDEETISKKTNYISSYFTLDYINSIIDKGLFKNNGLVLSTKHNIESFTYTIPDYKVNIINNIIETKYQNIVYNIHLNNQSKPNIKLLYDFRNIQKLAYNLNDIDFENYDYFFFSLDKYDQFIRAYMTDTVFTVFKENHLINKINSRKILLGYTIEDIDRDTYRKKFYSIYNDFETNFLTDITAVSNIDNFNPYRDKMDLNDLIYDKDTNCIQNYKYADNYGKTRLFIYELKEFYKINGQIYGKNGQIISDIDMLNHYNYDLNDLKRNVTDNTKFYIINQHRINESYDIAYIEI